MKKLKEAPQKETPPPENPRKDDLPKDDPPKEDLPKDDPPKEVQPGGGTTREAKNLHYEIGWSDEHFCLFRKEVSGQKVRGATEFSMSPVFDPEADPDAPAVCVFADGMRRDVPHLTMAPLSRCQVRLCGV